jgi:two-component system nitrogen regulation response regulator GlnG
MADNVDVVVIGVGVGGEETIRTDVRLLAATHRNLKQWSDDGKFRADLYHRISVGAIDLPPLRERGDDLPMLVRHHLRRFSREMGREAVEVSLAAMDRLRSYAWPGNVRELQNVVRQALLRTRGQVLLPEFLPELLQRADGVDSGDVTVLAVRGPSLESFIHQALAAGTPGLLEETYSWVDRILIPMVLEHTQGNRKQAAQILGIARQTLRSKLREMGAIPQLVLSRRTRKCTDEIQQASFAAFSPDGIRAVGWKLLLADPTLR